MILLLSLWLSPLVVVAPTTIVVILITNIISLSPIGVTGITSVLA